MDAVLEYVRSSRTWDYLLSIEHPWDEIDGYHEASWWAYDDEDIF